MYEVARTFKKFENCPISARVWNDRSTNCPSIVNNFRDLAVEIFDMTREPMYTNGSTSVSVLNSFHRSFVTDFSCNLSHFSEVGNCLLGIH